ncbi:hypothetical protein EJ05DRAFT_352995 [Pseudovirgaria hyperparasitica]|uniref:Uncharacterized protein n=1 Tax=Pseudovirgaria hyperparasitica TaxID=470096 RepID=A0A6A6W9F9_9PEZI|nr:uncharacterized protein EJ05DRAFT_352995 [Pseudovirgaria hyperparasitica]KAF2758506.1 hypothetical protein EJ05DRAFT_352995 [Pseudovirgaria hyperparasitica]
MRRERERGEQTSRRERERERAGRAVEQEELRASEPGEPRERAGLFLNNVCRGARSTVKDGPRATGQGAGIVLWRRERMRVFVVRE